MVIGIPREIHRHEHRVGLTPFAVSQLTSRGHQVFVEAHAGEAAHFTDRDFEESGASVVYSSEEVYKRADLVCRVGRPSTEELDLLKPGLVICAFQHLAVIPQANVERFMELETTLVGYEIVQDGQGDFPVLNPFSEMAGHMAIPLAQYYLQREQGGRGILIGNVPGVPPATVLILGAGTVGTAAARAALASGAHVVVADDSIAKLRSLSHLVGGQAVTVMTTEERLGLYTAIADVVIGAILIPGELAPWLITREMVMAMKPGAVVLDISIDQGGCVETSRLTTLDHPTFTVHDVVHYCVPNMTANVPRTASRVLSNVALPYIRALAEKGVDNALREDPALAGAVYMHRGVLTHQGVAELHGLPTTPLGELLGAGGKDR
ncbi:MAG: alanine dehydrogenase [Gemmatimonadota bacterium]|jgi:alanine dehydrogenase